jgi:hypothetical protein
VGRKADGTALIQLADHRFAAVPVATFSRWQKSLIIAGG